MSQEERSVFLEVSLSTNMYMYMCLTRNGRRDRAISQCSSQIVDKKILRAVSNTGIYYLRDKVGTVYLV
jgi:hypothetical protein